MKLRTIAAAAALAALGAGAVVAAEPQEVRSDMMKQVGGAMRELTGIARGEKPYDAALVTASLTTLSDVGKAFPDQFPAGSETGSGSEAGPRIWETPDDFRAKSEQMAADADALLASLPADQAGVGAALGVIGPQCGSCHEVYRVRR